MDTPSVPLNFVPAETGETFKVGTIQIRIMEDGSRTDNRIGSAEFTVPPHTSGNRDSSRAAAEDSHSGSPSFTSHALSRPKPLHNPYPEFADTAPRPTKQHDETFLITQGTLRFHGLDGKTIDAKLGDYITVPPRSPHTFSNPYDEPAKFFNTYTPAFYINYFKLLSTLGEAGKPMNPEANRRAMAYFATIGVADDEMHMDKQQFYGNGNSEAEKNGKQ
ncbi:uncharacterized protein A1O9_05832 [Exophiala aquamarina CBS 119918]|uniref:Cupin type-2 domain-containing protein n=1 Tax=Exophiala aquamarina CBS 119918 TaxID=1182545 RepID=A0A072PQX3_9EURO|nr:uncharacterized protein A1O9_05832 [Exophiala aquamarina CBS 119918]KEF57910.1 hypothetical protein A1O9_05832 [Exophiala aquamarina CBS 119918]